MFVSSYFDFTGGHLTQLFSPKYTPLVLPPPPPMKPHPQWHPRHSLLWGTWSRSAMTQKKSSCYSEDTESGRKPWCRYKFLIFVVLKYIPGRLNGLIKRAAVGGQKGHRGFQLKTKYETCRTEWLVLFWFHLFRMGSFINIRKYLTKA